MLCSSTYGCDDVTSSIVLMDAKDGCPTACEAKRQAQLAQLPCADAGPGDPNLIAFTTQLQKVAGRDAQESEHRRALAYIFSAVATHGCSFMYMNESGFPCNPGFFDYQSGAFIRLFEHFCPGTHACMLHAHWHRHDRTFSCVSLHGAARWRCPWDLSGLVS